MNQIKRHFTVTNGDSGPYSVDGGAPFNLPISLEDFAANQQAIDAAHAEASYLGTSEGGAGGGAVSNAIASGADINLMNGEYIWDGSLFVRTPPGFTLRIRNQGASGWKMTLQGGGEEVSAYENPQVSSSVPQTGWVPSPGSGAFTGPTISGGEASSGATTANFTTTFQPGATPGTASATGTGASIEDEVATIPELPPVTVTGQSIDGRRLTIKLGSLPEGAVSWRLSIDKSDGFQQVPGLAGGATYEVVRANGLLSISKLRAYALDGDGVAIAVTESLIARLEDLTAPALPVKPSTPIFRGYFTYPDGSLVARVAIPGLTAHATDIWLRCIRLSDGAKMSYTDARNKGWFEWSVQEGETYDVRLQATNRTGTVTSDKELLVSGSVPN